MPSPAKLTNQALTFNLHVERETGSAPRSFFYVEANHEAGRERRAAVVGGESRRNGPLLQARLAGQVALRVLRQALQVKDHRETGLVPASDLGVKFSDAPNSLAEQF